MEAMRSALVFVWMLFISSVHCFIKLQSYRNSITHLKDTSIVENFFDSWNRRDMDGAIKYFSEDCVYEDTSFANKFYGRNEVKKHLVKNAEAFPENTIIKIDKVSNDLANGNIGVQWHIEMNGIDLPSSRGCSMYSINNDGLIREGIDVLEPIPKVGGIALRVSKVLKTVGKFASFYVPKN